MRSLFQNVIESRLQIRQTAAFSIALHAFLLGCIVMGTIHVRRTVIFRPLVRGSSQQIAVVAVGRGALASILANEHPVLPEKNQPQPPRISRHPLPKPAKSRPTPQQPIQSTQTQATAQASAGKINPGTTGQGSDTQNMYPAYPTVSPSPQVRDRSLLPQTDQRVIVNVSLGADGRVEQVTLVSGLNNALDQLVLDTVRSWQFHPATVDGLPVPSQMELVFPFNRNYPSAE
jgi:TonB family protein